MKPALLLLILASGVLALNYVPQRANATHDPKNFTIVAQLAGWNSTLPAGTFTACSPTGTATCNPTITEFRGVAFTVTVKWKDSFHNFAIYTKGTTVVSSAHTCNPPGTNGCWARSATVTSSITTVTVNFTPTVPQDDFTGLGGYEYYCQFHPGSMHGKIEVLKSPDIDGDGKVTIVDAATLAFAFDTTPTSPQWNIATDLNNNGKVEIVDAAFLAFYFDELL